MTIPAIDLPATAHALRPVRIEGQMLIEYEAVTFPDNPRAGCDMYLRRCLHNLTVERTTTIIDVLDADGDILDDFYITSQGFEYLRNRLKFRRLR